MKNFGAFHARQITHTRGQGTVQNVLSSYRQKAKTWETQLSGRSGFGRGRCNERGEQRRKAPVLTNGIHPVCGRAAAGVSLRASPVLLTLQITVIWGMTKNPCICTGCSLRPEAPWKGKKWGRSRSFVECSPLSALSTTKRKRGVKAAMVHSEGPPSLTGASAKLVSGSSPVPLLPWLPIPTCNFQPQRYNYGIVST